MDGLIQVRYLKGVWTEDFPGPLKAILSKGTPGQAPNE